MLAMKNPGRVHVPTGAKGDPSKRNPRAENFVHEWPLVRNEIERAAAAAFGEPNRNLSTCDELRFGRKGSVSVCLMTGKWFDFESGSGGAFRAGGADHPQANRAVRMRTDYALRPGAAGKPDREAMARRLFEAAAPVAGTPGEGYLRRARGIALHHFPDDLRFLAMCPRHCEAAPAVVAALRDVKSTRIVGLQRIFIRPDGSGRDGDRMMIGSAAGAACMVSPNDEVTGGLIVAEGVETALSIMAIGLRPLWALMSAGAMRNFGPLDGIEALTIFADRDVAGIGAAQACAEAWAAAGREVRIIMAPQAGKDANDFLK